MKPVNTKLKIIVVDTGGDTELFIVEAGGT
jgi:hypothetical protein